MFSLYCLLGCVLLQESAHAALLIDTPLILSHDAASGYLSDKDQLVQELVVRYSKTQTQPMGEQLTCGARAFDYRPFVEEDGTTVIAHHGSTVIDVLMSDTITELKAWFASGAASERDREDVVLLYVSHIDGRDCDGGGCGREPVKAVLEAAGIAFIEDCSVLSTLTYDDARRMGSLTDSGPGSILAVFDCTSENYDSTVNCYGFVPDGVYSSSSVGGLRKDKYACYGDDENKQVAFSSLDRYLTNATELLLRPEGLLWMTQAHWQSDTASVPMGLVHNSSVTEDERRSGVNGYLATAMEGGRMSSLNFLELDEVCDGGDRILQLLRARDEN